MDVTTTPARLMSDDDRDAELVEREVELRLGGGSFLRRIWLAGRVDSLRAANGWGPLSSIGNAPARLGR
jgi:hypothetical protein